MENILHLFYTIYIWLAIHANLSHDKSGTLNFAGHGGTQQKSIIHRVKKSGGHNGEISCKSGTLEKIRSIEGRKKAGRPAKNGTVGKYGLHSHNPLCSDVFN